MGGAPDSSPGNERNQWVTSQMAGFDDIARYSRFPEIPNFTSIPQIDTSAGRIPHQVDLHFTPLGRSRAVVLLALGAHDALLEIGNVSPIWPHF
jgi:hypothetical protein